jgi:hypothetical protein
VRLVLGVGQHGLESMPMQSAGKFWWLWMIMTGFFMVLLVRFRYRPESHPMLLVFVTCVLLGIFPFTRFVYKTDLVPQSHRFLPELDMMVSLLCAIILTWIHDRFASRRVGRVALAAVAVFCIAVVAIWGPRVLANQHKPFYPVAEFNGFEKRAAEWFTRNVQGHERVFVRGNTVFWLNVFSDVAQVRGGLMNAVHPWWATLDSLWFQGENLDLMVLWSKAFNVRYALVNYPESADPWGPFHQPQRFEGKLKEVYAFEGNRIFEITMPSYSLVKVVNGNALAAVPPIIENPNEGGGIEEYVRMVEGGRETRYWLGPRNSFHIEAEIGRNELILVKTTYDRGWRAFCEGRQLPVRPDPAGFMLIYPDSPGCWDIVLEHGRVWEEWFGYGLTMLTLAGLGGYGYRRRKDAVTSRQNWLGKIRQTGDKGKHSEGNCRSE